MCPIAGRKHSARSLSVAFLAQRGVVCIAMGSSEVYRGMDLSKKDDRWHRALATATGTVTATAMTTAMVTADCSATRPWAEAGGAWRERWEERHDDGGVSHGSVAPSRAKTPAIVCVANWLRCEIEGGISSGLYAVHYIRWAIPLRCTSQLVKTIVDSWPVVVRTRSLLAASLNDPHSSLELLNRHIGESNDVVNIIGKLTQFRGDRILVGSRRSRPLLITTETVMTERYDVSDGRMVGVTLGMFDTYHQTFCRLWDRSEGARTSMSRCSFARILCHILTKRPNTWSEGNNLRIRRAASEPRIMMYEIDRAANVKGSRSTSSLI